MFGAGSLAAALAMPAVAAAAPVPSIDWHGRPALAHDAPGFQYDAGLGPWPGIEPAAWLDACLDGTALPACAGAALPGNAGAVSATRTAAVPEPGVWGMLLAGGALLGLTGRGRRRANEKFT